jgi:hypothetical protein
MNTKDKSEEVYVTYANNILLQASVWDLAFMFGLLNQDVTPIETVRNAEVRIPWTQAKLLVYFLKGQILWHELQNGKIHIPPAVMPPEPPGFELTEEQKNDPQITELIETFKKFHAELVASA